MKYYLLALPLLLFGCSQQGSDESSAAEKAPSQSSASEVVIVGTNPDYPPMQYIDTDTGEMVGYEIALMEAIAEEAGINMEWKPVEWKGIFAALESGEIDAIMSAATITEDRKKKYNFSDPYYTISQNLVIQRKDLGEVDQVEDIDGKIIGVQLATTGALMVEEEFPQWKTKTYDNAPLAFADLAQGSVFGFMVDSPVADAYSRANPDTAERFATVPIEFSKEEYGVVIRKGETELLEKINEGLKKVKESGVDAQLQAKWIDQVKE